MSSTPSCKQLGYDENRVWQIQAILKTQVEGSARSSFSLETRAENRNRRPSILRMQDGKHIIAGDEILPFGDHPYAGYRSELQQSADGPYRGTASKDFELVEFADFQCPHCKEAQANMDKLATDFPKARIVFQNYPLAQIHPASVTAASYAVCVTKLEAAMPFPIRLGGL